jgi:hypothetical protein
VTECGDTPRHLDMRGFGPTDSTRQWSAGVPRLERKSADEIEVHFVFVFALLLLDLS